MPHPFARLAPDRRRPRRATFGLAAVLAATAAAAGCSETFYTTPDSRAKARQLNRDLGRYRQDQADRVDRVNAEYREAFARLMAELRTLYKAQLAQDREADAQRIADAIVSKWDTATLRAAFRQAFADAVVTQRERIRQTDEALAATRDAYAASYQDAKLKLALIDQVRADLTVLSEDVTGLRRLAELARLIAEAYEKGREDAEKAEGKA